VEAGYRIRFCGQRTSIRMKRRLQACVNRIRAYIRSLRGNQGMAVVDVRDNLPRGKPRFR